MNTYSIKLEIKSSLEDVKAKLSSILTQLEMLIDDKDILFEIRLILNELVINGVMHGNEMDDTKKVHLNVDIEDGFMKIYVKDEGRGFEHCTDSYDISDLHSHGRGLLLVDGLCDEMVIKDNEVSVKKSIKKEAV